jgi:hypothetical protein
LTFRGRKFVEGRFVRDAIINSGKEGKVERSFITLLNV